MLAKAVGQAMKMLNVKPSSRAGSLPQVGCDVAEGMRSKTVGASLLAIASCQSNDLVLTHRHREQAHSYRLNAVCLKECDQTVGASLLAKAVGQSMKMLDVTPLSRAGSLLQVERGLPEGMRSKTVGASLLAKAVGQAMKILNVKPPSRAGSLLQVERGLPEGMRSNCGSEPARESGGSVNEDVGCDAAFASRLAPTGLCGDLESHENPALRFSLITTRHTHPRHLLSLHENYFHAV